MPRCRPPHFSGERSSRNPQNRAADGGSALCPLVPALAHKRRTELRSNRAQKQASAPPRPCVRPSRNGTPNYSRLVQNHRRNRARPASRLITGTSTNTHEPFPGTFQEHGHVVPAADLRWTDTRRLVFLCLWGPAQVRNAPQQVSLKTNYNSV